MRGRRRELGVALAAVVVLVLLFVAFGWMRRGAVMGDGMMGRPYPERAEFASDGQRIYETATSDTGSPITFTGGPPWLSMHGGSCASCHGPEGRGGRVVPMTDVVAPDIRYDALASEHMEHGGEEHPPYTVPLIKRAIIQGLDPAGHPLSEVMPRWRMSERELDELVGYLRTLGG